MKPKHIIIVGAGYGGVTAALRLARSVRDAVTITVIDRHTYQLFAPDLYEVASSPEEFASTEDLKESVRIPLKEIFSGTAVSAMQAEVTAIDTHERTVTAGGKKLQYDYLIVSTGSETDSFGIPGVLEYALGLKSAPDALAVRNKIGFAIEAARTDVQKKNIRILVGGGGFSGVEFAAELTHDLDRLAWKNQYPREKIEIMLLEAMPQLLGGMDKKLSQDALWRLTERGVRVLLSSPLAKVEPDFINLANGERIAYDVLVWTAGVKARAVPFTPPLPLSRRGKVAVNEYLQPHGHHNIFIIGDGAAVMDSKGHAVPDTAQFAIEQGKYVARVLPLFMVNKKPAPYEPSRSVVIVALGGKWAIFKYRALYFRGFFAYVIRELVHLRYFIGAVGLWKAVARLWLQMDQYRRND